MDEITKAVSEGNDIAIGVARETLRHAVQVQITSPYGGGVLDVRRAVLLDGSDHGGKMHIMTADEYDIVVGRMGGLDVLESRLGYKVDVYDGRQLFA